PLIDHRQHPKRPTVGQLVVHEIHTPAILRPHRCRRRTPVQRPVLAPTDPSPQLQTFQPVQTPDPLDVHRPPLAAEQHVDALKPEAGPGQRDLPNPGPERLLRVPLRAPIPARTAQLSQPTRPHGAALIRGLKPLGQLPAAGRLQTFFLSASLSICLSRVRSATTCFNRRFSSSTCRRRRSSLTPRWAYFFFQR